MILENDRGTTKGTKGHEGVSLEGTAEGADGRRYFRGEFKR